MVFWIRTGFLTNDRPAGETYNGGILEVYLIFDRLTASGKD